MYTFITFSTFYSLLINSQPTLPNAFKSYTSFSYPVFINRRVSASVLSGIKIDKWSLSAPPPFHDQQCCKVVRLVCNRIVKVSGSFLLLLWQLYYANLSCLFLCRPLQQWSLKKHNTPTFLFRLIYFQYCRTIFRCYSVIVKWILWKSLVTHKSTK